MSTFWQDAHIEKGELAQELSSLQIQLRDRFVEEYMFDEDPLKACIRIGFQASYANTYANELMNETYVLNKIKEIKLARSKDKDIEEEDILLIENTLREAMKHGPYASRVAAAGRLAVILGLDAPSKTDVNFMQRGGVMVLQPDNGMEDWEAQAKASQNNLVKDTRSDV